MNGADETSVIGNWICERKNTSLTVPPDTERNVPPANPVKNRDTMTVCMF